MNIYIARDNDGSLWIFDRKPNFDDRFGEWVAKGISEQLNAKAFPSIKPGECVEFELKGAVT